MRLLSNINSTNLKKIIPYLAVSVIATLIDFSAYIILLNVFSWYYIYANMVSIVFGILSKFSLNRLITFKDRNDKPWQHQFRRFLMVSGSGFILSNIVLALSIEIINIPEDISKVLAIGVVFSYTFVLHNFYSFK